MIESSSRVEEFKAEVADLKVKDPSRGRDEVFARVGAVLLGLGIVLAIVAYPLSHSTSDALQQRDAIVLALLGLTCAVVGAALYVRNTIASFLRFWLTRVVYEQRAQADRVVEAMHGPREEAAALDHSGHPG
jgi:hypothetical protein